MSFGFQFDDEELDEEYRDAVKDSEDETLGRDATSSEPAVETISSKASKHTLEELLSALPSRISYSSLKVPLKELQKTLYRRDLFDARFQLINDDQEDDSEGSKGRFSAGAQTDLVPGVYEGGFKTWECAIDLVAHLEECISQEGDVSLLCDAKVTELGCGTALPSMYLFSRMLSAKEETIDSSFALCDFNEQVLRLVTLPNLVLTWYFHSQVDQADPNGEIEVTQELIEDFETSLKNRKITFEFYSGSWDSLDQAGAFDQSDAKRNIVLTSETIYSTQSLPSLVNALELACNGSIESSMQRAALTDTEDKSKSRSDLCLVAAKVLYFGVGGGVDAFNEHIKRRQGSTKTVWKSERGVSRLVLQVDFGAAAS